jgi:hypothetical protein
VSEVAIPEDVRQFLIRHIQSIAQLEILLLLYSAPERSWTIGDAYKVVLSNQELVEKTLERFCRLGLARKSETGTYQFSPASDQVRALVTRLATLYRERQGRIIQAIYEAPVSEIEEFAKAFKIRKDP